MKKIYQSAWAQIAILFFAVSFLFRTILLFKERTEIDFSVLLLTKIYLVGLFLDLITLSYFAFIPLLYYALIPNKIFIKKPHQYFLLTVYFIFIYLIIFNFLAEWFFWDEFSTRFNFIAVDYLIYTTEVIANIVESYPIYELLLAIFIISAFIFCLTYKNILKSCSQLTNFSKRIKSIILPIAITIIAFFMIDGNKVARISDNNYVDEITYNGIYQLFYAYRHNQLDYETFYLTQNQPNAVAELKNKISSHDPQIKFINSTADDFWYKVPHSNSSNEKKYNVILITVESLSAEFLGVFGNKDNLTPNLDRLAKESLFLTHLKATGTRTVRGLEAITLSIPPTPGNSIVRRPNNENLFNISTPFKKRGYDVSFIYGGKGYFDNMNYFFKNNGFRIIDRASFDNKKIAFSNAWGVSDEDLFNKAIEENDKSYESDKPFFNLLMTTSNHRPFTYPEGRIDILPKTGRNGAVKYTDYAINKFINDAKEKPWFKNTIFIIVADHCAGSAGNSDLPVWRYQIPAMFYAPHIIKPQIIEKKVSQIDIAPTLMGMMNFSYKSKFFGQDILKPKAEERAFISTYSKLGYYKNDKLYMLDLKKVVKIYDVKINSYSENGSLETITKDYQAKDLNEAVNYYQGASYLFKNNLLKNNEGK
jgi:phosphoglycerol transferase MdoB-like AlkP superfamily enzyme